MCLLLFKNLSQNCRLCCAEQRAPCANNPPTPPLPFLVYFISPLAGILQLNVIKESEEQQTN
jgi:hypothetical protein